MRSIDRCTELCKASTRPPPRLEAEGFRGCRLWQSVVINGLPTFLVIGVFADHLAGDCAGADGKVSPGPELPQNFVRKWGNACSSIFELISFNHCIIWLIRWFGQYRTNRCGPVRPSPDTVSSTCSPALCRSRLLTGTAASPVSTALRYSWDPHEVYLKISLCVRPSQQFRSLLRYTKTCFT